MVIIVSSVYSFPCFLPGSSAGERAVYLRHAGKMKKLAADSIFSSCIYSGGEWNPVCDAHGNKKLNQ